MKKKGLIISTVVMVVVLIAALTTTTFAWFSTQATATVDEMTIETAASNGLQIACYDFAASTAHWYNGELTTTATKGNPAGWSGVTESVGPSVAFTTDSFALFGASGDGFDMYTAGEEDGSVTGSTASKLYKAAANYNYFTAVLDLKNASATEAAQNVIATIKYTATGFMAASARVAIFAYNGDGAPAEADMTDSTKWDEKVVFAPFGKSQNAGATWTNSGSTLATYLKESEASLEDYTTSKEFSGFTTGSFENLVEGTDSIVTSGSTLDGTEKSQKLSDKPLGQLQTAAQDLYIKLVIWYEGTDSECVASYTGTGLTLSIEFTKEAIGG